MPAWRLLATLFQDVSNAFPVSLWAEPSDCQGVPAGSIKGKPWVCPLQSKNPETVVPGLVHESEFEDLPHTSSSNSRLHYGPSIPIWASMVRLSK